MTRVLFLSLFLCFSLTLTAQPENSPATFFQQIENGKPSYIRFDTLATGQVYGKALPTTIYLEADQYDDQWFFAIYYEQDNVARQFLCQCGQDTLQAVFAQMAGHWETHDLNPYRLLFLDHFREDFLQTNCLSALYLPPFLNQIPVIRPLLDGHISPPGPAGDTLVTDVTAQMILREDGNWILDLEGEIEANKRIIDIDSPNLLYLRSAEANYFPAPEVAEWKSKLVQNGHHTSQLIGYATPNWDNDLGNFRKIDTPEPDHSWNIQFMLQATAPPMTALETAGSIGLVVVGEEKTSFIRDFEFLEANKRYEFQLLEEGKLKITEVNGPKGDFRTVRIFYADSQWRNISIHDDSGAMVISIDHDQKPQSFVLQTQPNTTYRIHNTQLKKDTIRIPFRQQLSPKPLQATIATNQFSYRFDFLKMNHWTISSDQHRIEAWYDFYFPEHSSADTFILHAAYDNTGKDLLLAQSDSIDSYNTWLESLGKDRPWWAQPINEDWKFGTDWDPHLDGYPRPHYHLEVRLWDKPAPTARCIYLEGEVQYHGQDGEAVKIPWKDSLQIGLPYPDSIVNTASRTESRNGLSPLSVTIGTREARGKQGLEAKFEFPIPAGHSYTSLNHAHSKLNFLRDNMGQDLLALDQTMAKWNRQERKRYLTPPSNNYLNLYAKDWTKVYNYIYPTVEFFVKTRVAPTEGATQVYGQAEIVYNYVAVEEMQIHTETISYEQQDKIELFLDGHLVTFELYFRTEEVEGITYKTYRLKKDGLAVLIAETNVVDGEEILSPDPDDENFSGYDIFIPEDLTNRTLTINVAYVPIHSQQETVDFELSMDGIFSN